MCNSLIIDSEYHGILLACVNAVCTIYDIGYDYNRKCLWEDEKIKDVIGLTRT